MKDETFELLTKMYSEFSQRFDSMENRMDSIENGQRKLETLIENDVKKDIKALYDGYNQVYEKVVVIEKKVDDLTDRVDKQDIRISVIKGGKPMAEEA